MGLMARQMGITPPQLNKIVSGEWGQEDYYQLLEESGRIPRT
jgi:hypothetical protein